MAGIKVDRLDLDRRRVEVVEAISEPRGVIVRGTPKNHGRRSAPFPEFVQPTVKARAVGKIAEAVLFVGQDGGVLRAGKFRNRFFNPAVQRMLGRASAAMALDVYADLFDDDLDSVAAALNKGAVE